jgi:hypothetical protein
LCRKRWRRTEKFEQKPARSRLFILDEPGESLSLGLQDILNRTTQMSFWFPIQRTTPLIFITLGQKNSFIVFCNSRWTPFASEKKTDRQSI